MSADTSLSHQNVCYVHCSFCNSILAVSMPFNNMMNTVTVRCGHCTNLLYVNVGGLLQFGSLPFQHGNTKQTNYGLDYGSSSSSRCGRIPWVNSYDHQKYVPMNPPKKKQRVPSAYNRFIKEEIQRIKACNPDISHREAFGAAAKNWAHFPHIHFGLNVAENK